MSELEPYPPASPLRGVRWTFGFVALLFYMYVVTTYRINAGTLGMSLALAGLLLQPLDLRVPSFLKWLGLLLLWSTIGYAVTNYPGVVWDTVQEDGKLWLIGFVIVNTIVSRPQLRFFMIFFLGCFALYPVRGAILSFFIYGGSIQGRAAWNYIYNNPNDLAAFCLLQLSLAAAVLTTEPKGWMKRAAVAGVIVLPFLILLTQSRGAIIAMAVFGLLILRKLGIKVRRLLWVVVIGVGVIVSVPSSVWQRVKGLENATSTANLDEVDPEGSAKQRFEIMKVAAAIGMGNPVFGVGRGAYKLAHEQYAMRPEFDPIARGKRDTHDTFLNVFAETGLVGIILFCGMIVSTLVNAQRARRRHQLSQPRATRQLLFLELGLIAFLIAGIFGTLAYLTFTYIHLALIAKSTQMLDNPPSRSEGLDGRRGVAIRKPRVLAPEITR